MTRKINWFTALALGISSLSQAETAPTPAAGVTPPASTVAEAPVTVPMGVAVPQAPDAPVRDVKLPFTEVAPPPGTFILRGTRPKARLSLAYAATKWFRRRCWIGVYPFTVADPGGVARQDLPQ